MLLRNKAEFEHVAREWAIKFAGAPKKERGEGSGGATADSIIRKRQQAKESEEKAKLAACVDDSRSCVTYLADRMPDTAGIVRSLSTGSFPWGLTCRLLSRLSSTWGSTRWEARITSWKRHILEISLPGFLVNREVVFIPSESCIESAFMGWRYKGLFPASDFRYVPAVPAKSGIYFSIWLQLFPCFRLMVFRFVFFHSSSCASIGLASLVSLIDIIMGRGFS